VYTIMMNGFGLVLSINLVFLATNWNEIMKFWSEHERIFSSEIYNDRKHIKRFRKNLAIVSTFIIGYGIC
jgi:hypothetical protein